MPGTLERLGLGWDILRAWHPGLDPRSDFRVGTDRPRQRAARLRHARRSGQRLCRDERRAGRRADRAELSARRHDVRRCMRSTPSCSRSTTATSHGGAGQVIDLALFESLFSLLGPLPAEYAALGRERPRNGSRSQQRRTARLLSDARRRLDRGQRIDAEDGGAIPPQLRAGLAASTIRALPPTRPACTRRELDRRVGEAIAIAHARRERRDHRARTSSPPCPVQTIADIEPDPHWRARQLTVDVDRR